MDAPTGKIHRVRQDGTVPEDNPFWVPDAERDPTSTRHTVCSPTAIGPPRASR